MEGAAAVTTTLLAGRPAADALMCVAERARLLADAAAGVVLQPTPEGGMEIVAASTHGDPGDLVGTAIAPGSPVLTQLLGGEPVFIDDSATDPRMTTHVRERFGPSMMLPLQSGGQLIGTLALPRARGGPRTTPWTGCWPRSSPPRPRWPSYWRTPSTTVSSWRSTRTATGSRGTCTTWWSSGCSRRR
ncbi:GAF domain-containing protein [Streptomyces nojiriensis]